MNNFIISDLHIDETELDFFKSKRKELIDNNIKDIIAQKPKRVFLNGDIFNKDTIKVNGYAAQLFINSIALPLINNNIELHILLGNHERGGKSDTFAFLKGNLSNPLINIHDKIENTEFEDFNAIFVPFMYKGDREVLTVQKLQDIVEKEIIELVSKLKNKNKDKPVVIFNHNMMSDLPFDIGKEMNIKLWEIKGVDFVFGGHIHKTEEFSVNKKVKGMYVGSLMKSFVYEEESEGYVGFDIKDNNILYNYINNKSFNYEKIEIRDTIQFDPSIIKENTVYDISFIYTSQTADEYFIQNVLSEIEHKHSYVKKHIIINEESDINLSKGITLLTNEEDILKGFFTDNKIRKKEDKERYFEKLEKCMRIGNEGGSLEKETKDEKKVLNSVRTANNLSKIVNTKLAL